MACETIDLFTRRRILIDLGRLSPRELPPSEENNVLILRDYRARRQAISRDEETAHRADSSNDEYEDYTLFP